MSSQKQTFIDSIAKFAVADYARSKVLPSLTIAQAILESGWGRSGQARTSKNLFGIKAGKSWKGAKRSYKTKEFEGGKWIEIDAFFREYDTFEGSIRDHNDLLQLPRYKPVRDAKDYKEACREIRECGYATDPKYTELLIRIIEENGLAKYDVPNQKQDGDYEMTKEDADKIISFLRDAWERANTDAKKKEIGRLADEVRKSSGQEPQNK